MFDFTLQQYFRPEGNWICYVAALTWNSNAISTHLSPRLHKILVMYEKVNISITLTERERLRLYRSKTVSSDTHACLSETAENLVCRKSTESIFLCICFCEDMPRPGYNSKSEIMSLLSRFVSVNVSLERPNPSSNGYSRRYILLTDFCDTLSINELRNRIINILAN